MHIKEKVYNSAVKIGIGAFQKLFPEFFGKEPLAPTDRYLEYHFAIKNLPKAPAKILDVGCAGSYFPLLLAGFGYEVSALDIRSYPILNKLSFSNFNFFKADIKNTGFQDDYFDVITAISSIEHIGISGRYGVNEDLEGDREAVKEMRRILKPKAIALITIPFGISKIIRPETRIYDEARVKDIFSGFTLEQEEYYMQDDTSGDWFRCSKDQAGKFNCRSDRYPLCLLKLRKNN